MKEVPGELPRRQAMLLQLGSSRDLGLLGSDRAFAHKIHREAVVWRSRLDRALSRCSSRPLDKLDTDVLCCLRIGAVQLLVLGTPPHAAVSSTVAVLRDKGRRSYANAVLRKLARTGEESDLPLQIRYSHPYNLIQKWESFYSGPDLEKLLAWNNTVPDIGGYCFDSQSDSVPGTYVEQVGFDPIPDNIYIQDRAAAVAGEGAASLPGETVLEFCAAPGGKTAHLDRTSRLVISVDSSVKRMERWLENAERLGWLSSIPVTAACEQLPFREHFDKVIVDAPCTNTGVYRRRFDARWNWSAYLLSFCTDIQQALLNSAAEAVKEGGILVYSTCSLEREENVDQVRWFEKRFPGFRRMDFPAPPELVTDGLLSIFPPEHKMDGLFAAAWKRVL